MEVIKIAIPNPSAHFGQNATHRIPEERLQKFCEDFEVHKTRYSKDYFGTLVNYVGRLEGRLEELLTPEEFEKFIKNE